MLCNLCKTQGNTLNAIAQISEIRNISDYNNLRLLLYHQMFIRTYNYGITNYNIADKCREIRREIHIY